MTYAVFLWMFSILISVFLEYITYATNEQQPDRIRMDLLLKAMKVWMLHISRLFFYVIDPFLSQVGC